MDLNKALGTKGRVVKLPDKRTVNLAVVGVEKLNLPLATVGVILIVLAAVLFSKFGVIDRMIAVSRAQGEVRTLQRQIDEGYDKIASYGEIGELYAHYTYADMTEEELNRVDRAEVMDMIDRVVRPKADVSAITVQENQLVIALTTGTLQQANLISQQLLEERIVDFCTVTMAATENERVREEEFAGGVNSQITVTLKPFEEQAEDDE